MSTMVRRYMEVTLRECVSDNVRGDGKVGNIGKLGLEVMNTLLSHQTYEQYMYHLGDIAMMPKGWGCG